MTSEAINSLGFWEDRGLYLYLDTIYLKKPTQLILRKNEEKKEGNKGEKEGERKEVRKVEEKGEKKIEEKRLIRGFVPTSRLPAILDVVSSPTKQEVADYILKGKKIPVFNPRLASNGIRGEPYLFQWYYDKFSSPTSLVKAAGAAVSKDTMWLVSIADAEVGDDGLVEFKVREQLNSDYMKGFIPLRDYIQLQAELHSYHRKWVDYVVLGRLTGHIFKKRVYPDTKFWNKCKEKGEAFVLNYLKKK